MLSTLDTGSSEEQAAIENIEKMFDVIYKMSMERDVAQESCRSTRDYLASEQREIMKLKAEFLALSEEVRVLEAERNQLLMESSRDTECSR